MFIFVFIFVVLCTYVSLKSAREFRILQQLKIPEHRFSTHYPLLVESFYTIIKLGISSSEERFKVFGELCLQYSDSVKIWFGPKLVVFVNHPDRIQKVLLSQKCADKWNLFYDLMERETALTASRATPRWKEHRKFFNNCFISLAIDTFAKAFADCSDDLVVNLKKHSDGMEFDFLPLAKKFSFCIVCETALDMKTKDLFDEATSAKIFNAFET